MNTHVNVSLADTRRFLRLTTFADAPDAAAATDTLCLPFDLRTKSRWMVKLESGREALLVLPRGRAMRGGDQLVAADGTRVNVQAADEALAHVTVPNAHELLRVAYHLGNRHVAVEIGDGYLRVLQDSVLENMVRGLGATVERVMAPFEPEGGAYAGTHDHGNAHAHEAHASHSGHDHGDHSACNHGHDQGHDHHDHSNCTHDHHDHGHSHGHEGGKARIHDFSDAAKTHKEG
jgi:urease accessory protein